MKFFSIFLTLFFLLNINSNSQIVSDTWENCSKYLGNISRDLSSSNITTTPENWLTYWNQVTPSNAGKWGFIEGQRDVMRWDGLDKAYQLAKDNGLKFKQHTLIWGNQQPAGMDNLSAEEQLEEMKSGLVNFVKDIQILIRLMLLMKQELINQTVERNKMGLTEQIIWML